METTAIFEKKIAIEPKDLNNVSNTSVDSIVLEKLRNNLERKCSQHGWVIPKSLKLISRSMCQAESGRFTGSMMTWVQVEARVIYPTDGMIIVGDVIKKNKMGMFVLYKDAIHVMVPRDLHLGSEEYDDVAVGDNVEVELKKSSFQVNDTHILSVGIFHKKIVEGESEVGLSATVKQEEDEEEEGAEEQVEAEEQNEAEEQEEQEKDDEQSSIDKENETED